MQAAHLMLIERQRQAHVSQLSSWAQRASAARSVEDAMRIACHKPVPGPLIRSARMMFVTDERRYEAQIDGLLAARLAKITNEAELRRCLEISRFLPWARDVKLWARGQHRKMAQPRQG